MTMGLNPLKSGSAFVLAEYLYDGNYSLCLNPLKSGSAFVQKAMDEVINAFWVLIPSKAGQRSYRIGWTHWTTSTGLNPLKSGSAFVPKRANEPGILDVS